MKGQQLSTELWLSQLESFKKLAQYFEVPTLHLSKQYFELPEVGILKPLRQLRARATLAGDSYQT